MRLFKKKYILNLDGEYFLDGKNFKQKIKRFLIKGAQDYLIAGEKSGENLSKYVSKERVHPYYFSSLTNKELEEHAKNINQNLTNKILVVEPFMNIDDVKKIAITLIIMYCSSAILSFIGSLTMTDIANKFAKSLRTRISKKINKLPLSYFDQHSIGDILSRVTNDVDTIAQSMNQSLASLVTNIVLFLGSIFIMFYTNWILALTAILSSLIGFVGMTFILNKSQKYFIAIQEELGNLN